MTKAYAILDYDGYICKSFYANKEDIMDINSAKEILKDLTNAAIDKTKSYFSTEDVVPLMIISDHSWKKDIYPSYKRSRKRNEYLGLYRDHIKESFKKDLTKVSQLEADEVIVCISDWLRSIKSNFIVFSDDKDLRYYSELYCKINITEEVIKQDPVDMWKLQLEQMLIGDKEDNIQGIPKVGEKTAPKLLEAYGYDIRGVVKCYKDRQIEIDNCLRDLLLIIPLSQDYLEDNKLGWEIAQAAISYGEADELDINKALISQIKFLNNIVREVYDND